MNQEVVEGQYDPELEDGSHPFVFVGHEVLEGEEGRNVEDEQLARVGVTQLQNESSPSKKAIYGIIYFVNSQLTMEGSRYYGENPYLSSIFQKQQRQSKPIKVEQVSTPFHFLKKDMNEDEQKQLLQKKIFDNPSLYISTHVKCQICNKYIELQLANHHSRIHFEEEERISKILQRNTPSAQQS